MLMILMIRSEWEVSAASIDVAHTCIAATLIDAVNTCIVAIALNADRGPTQIDVAVFAYGSFYAFDPRPPHLNLSALEVPITAADAADLIYE